MTVDQHPLTLPMARQGKTRALTQTTANKSPAAFDVPTMAEFVPGFETTIGFAMFAPANVPKPLIAKLNAEVVRMFRLPNVQECLKTPGLIPVLFTLEEQARYQALKSGNGQKDEVVGGEGEGEGESKVRLTSE